MASTDSEQRGWLGPTPVELTGQAASVPFLDREREMATLQAALAEAIAGRGRLLLIAGEGGIGKTRLVRELAERGQQAGSGHPVPWVVWGRCWDSGGAPSMWPWIGVLRELFSDRQAQELREDLGAGAPWLAQLVPDLREALPELVAEPRLDSEQSRFVLFDALSGFLRRTSNRRPLLIVLDDIHAADQLSLLALLFLARQLSDMSALLIGTHREAETNRTQGLAGLFAKLARAGQSVQLSGLAPEHLGELIEHHRGERPDRETAQTIHRATGGNPFFADEVVRMLVLEGRLESAGTERVVPLPVPTGVRGLIEQRVQALPPPTVEILRSAAVIGGEFTLGTLANVSRRERGELLQALEQAVSARLIEPSADEVASFHFVHGLIRETAYAGLGQLERAQAHATVGRALERRYAGVTDRHVEVLAHHFLEALPEGDPAVALAYASQAADRAMAQFAYERAARLYVAALEALDLMDDLGEAERSLHRAKLLVGIGSAQLRIADPRAREMLLEAADAARGAGSSEALADAALAFGAFALSPGLVDHELTALLDEALQAVPSEDSPVRACLLARLARALYWSRDANRRRQLIDEAVAMARRLEDAHALGFVLGNCIPASRSPDTAELELQWIDELLSLPQPRGDLVVIARSNEIDLLLERGALSATDAAIDRLEGQADRLRDVRARPYVSLHRARRATMEGRWSDAERCIGEAAELAPDAIDSTIPILVGGALLQLRVLQGRPHEFERELRRVVDAAPEMRVWRAALALIYARTDRGAEAQQLLARVAGRELSDIARDSMWLITLALLSEVCAAVGDQQRAEQLYGALLPAADLNVISSVNGYLGPATRYLGLLARTLGELPAAQRHLRDALKVARAQRTPPLIALIAADLAEALAAAGEAGARVEAAALADEAAWLAHELQLDAVARRASALASELAAAPPAAVARTAPRQATAAPSSNTAALTRGGEVWSFGYEDRTVLVRESKGVRHLAALLSRPGVEVHALDLVRETDVAEPMSAAAASAADLAVHDPHTGSGSALDSAAKAAYRRRLEDLREELEEAERWRDPERACHAREEIDFIAGELASAMGLGGRDRPQSSDAERARVNVTRAIKSAIRRLAQQDPKLAAELETTVRTGLFCRYEPDVRRPLRWEIHGR